MKNAVMENKQVLNIATLNLNGETWFAINHRPRLPEKLFSIQSIKKELTDLTIEGLKNLLKDGKYDVIAIQELIYSKKERNAIIKKAIEDVKDASNEKLYTLLLPDGLDEHTHFTVGFIVKKQLEAKLKKRKSEESSDNGLVKNRIVILELPINGKKYSIINMHVNNHNIVVQRDSENTILLGDMNACTDKQSTDEKALNNNFLESIVNAGWCEIGSNDNYTWKSNNVERKLDHIYICKDAQKENREEVINEVNFYYDEKNGFTDHSMLVSTLVFD